LLEILVEGDGDRTNEVAREERLRSSRLGQQVRHDRASLLKRREDELLFLVWDPEIARGLRRREPLNYLVVELEGLAVPVLRFLE
jgi:hypothetical protein